jgi:hypothetical protein
MAVPYTFSTATGSLPLSQLDSNFSTAITIGNTAVVLGDSITTINNLTLGNVAITSVSSAFPNGYLANSNVIVGTTTLTLGSTVTSINGLSLSNVTISSGNVTISNVTTTNVTATTANVTTANVSTLVVTGNQTSLGNVAITGNVSANIVTVAAGAVGTPSITTTGDTNTGIFFPAADTVGVTTGGSERVRVDSSGNVGIGVTPSVKLDVVGTVQSNGVFSINGTTTGTASKVWFGSDGGGGGFINVPTGYGLSIFQNNATNLAKFDSAGNLGLGVTPSAWSTTNSTKALQISSRGSVWANVNSTSINNNWYLASGDVNTYIVTGPASRYNQSDTGVHQWFYAASGTAGTAITFTQAMTLDASGNLGIGTTSTAGYA